MVESQGKEKKKVQLIARSYYARKDIQKAMYDFCKNRETVPRYLEGFGKRPDCFDYPSDVNSYAKKGATSFHCSEELWVDPLKINTDMTPQEYDKIRIGWDFLIDIDSKYLDYSKIAAKLLLKELERHGLKNVGIKFSGSKGFHIIIPFVAFPNVLSGRYTKDMFPDWARLIADYLSSRVKPELNREIFKISNPEELEKKGLEVRDKLCPKCSGVTTKKKIGVYRCPNFRCRAEVKSMKSNRKKMLCPSCNDMMQRVSEEEVYFCENCKTDSATLESSVGKRGDDSHIYEKERENSQFNEVLNAEKAIDSVDIVLVSSRHLFRAPYSLHEKTALSSIVLSKDDIDGFKPSDADPLKIGEVKSFMPSCESEEGKELLLQAIDNAKQEEPKAKKYSGEPLNLEGVEVSEDMFPPIIKKLNKGIPDDGRKRALYILLSFYNSLQFPEGYIEDKIREWNKKNRVPLKEGYLRSQLVWFNRRKPLPPNYDKPIYKEFGIKSPPEPGVKNPISYTIKRALKAKARKSRESGKEEST